MKQKIILASGSPRRKEILQSLGVEFQVAVMDVKEDIEKDIPVHLFVQELALLKGAATAKNFKSGLVISADTVVWNSGKILGKPKDSLDAVNMLKTLSGNVHKVYTGVCVIDACTGKTFTDYEMTSVVFCDLTEEEIENYVQSGEPMDKAGSYGIQGLGSLLVSRIHGDYFNVVGLPVSKLFNILKNEFDFKLL